MNNVTITTWFAIRFYYLSSMYYIVRKGYIVQTLLFCFTEPTFRDPPRGS